MPGGSALCPHTYPASTLTRDPTAPSIKAKELGMGTKMVGDTRTPNEHGVTQLSASQGCTPAWLAGMKILPSPPGTGTKQKGSVKQQLNTTMYSQQSVMACSRAAKSCHVPELLLL